MENKYEIRIANGEKDYDDARQLFNEYAGSLNFNLCFQDFARELDEIPAQYGKPHGGIVLLDCDNSIVGCTGIRKFSDKCAELKRMYIKPECRGRGLGHKLLDSALDLAVNLGYTKIKLDTIKIMDRAISIYKDAGFTETEAYRYNPIEDAMFFEKDISPHSVEANT